MLSGTPTNTSEQALSRATWQRTIFSEPLRRDELLRLRADFPLASLRIRVSRNDPFEFVAAAAEPFLAYAGYAAEFAYSAYDDSLAFFDGTSADVEIVWLDYARYASFPEFAPWFRERISELRSRSTAPILIASSPLGAGAINAALDATAAAVPGVYICDQSAIARKMGPAYLDSRLAGVAGTTLSGAACLETARMFGLVWIPAAVGARIKAIAVDLDQTLYAGVLAEDGAQGVHLTEAHGRLQKRLLEYRNQGVFLAAVSRNEMADVVQLFQNRTDFPLKLEHFSAHSINWRAKGIGLREIASTLRIGVDTILFLDDNAGELAAVASEVPGMPLLYAGDPDECERALGLYPGLAGGIKTLTDELRVRDLEAAARRATLRAQAPDARGYLRSLDVGLSFYYNPAGQVRRMHELSVKTNQFNTAFLRLSEAEIAQRVEDSACATVAVGLKDKLTDSGIVAAVFGRWVGRELRIEEVVISCRALGRELETAIIGEAVSGILARSQCMLPTCVEFAFTAGERNRPAREWLEGFTGAVPASGTFVRLPWAAEPASLAQVREVISLEWVEEKP